MRLYRCLCLKLWRHPWSWPSRSHAHRLNVKSDAKPVKQQQPWFHPDIMEAIETEVYKLIKCGFIREEQHPIGLLILCPFLERTKRSGTALTFTILMRPVLKMNFHYPSQMSWFTIRVILKGCLLWMASQDTIKSNCTWMTKSTSHFEHLWGCFATRWCHMAWRT